MQLSFLLLHFLKTIIAKYLQILSEFVSLNSAKGSHSSQGLVCSGLQILAVDLQVQRAAMVQQHPHTALIWWVQGQDDDAGHCRQPDWYQQGHPAEIVSMHRKNVLY